RATPGASASADLSRSRSFLGTLGYMPPEQMRDAKAADARADVFALGAIVHECFAGVPAFRAENPLAAIAAVERGLRTPLRELAPATPAWLERVVARALEVEPERRFADAGELARALEGPAPARSMRASTRVVLLLLGATSGV